MNDNEIELWIEYKENYNLEARDALIEKYLNYSYSIGLKIYRRYSDFIHLENEEIFGITSFTLIKAIEAYDHTKNVPFVKFLNKVMNWYLKEEFSKYMNVSIRDQLKIFKKISNNKSNSLVKLLISLSYRNMAFTNNFYDKNISSEVNRENILEGEDILHFIRQAMDNVLGESEKKVLEKMYFEGKKLGVVAKEINLSKQRINQIHRTALEKIKKYIKDKTLS